MKTLLILTLLINISWAKDKCIVDSSNLQGKGLLTYSWFSVELYNIAYYKSKQREVLKLNFRRDIDSYYLNQGWDEGLKSFEKNKSNKLALDWLKENSPNAKEDDCLEYHKYKNGNVELIFNNKKVAKTNSKVLASMVFYPWIGDDPVDKKLKQQLLGK